MCDEKPKRSRFTLAAEAPAGAQLDLL